MNVLITGGTGYVGSRLVQALSSNASNRVVISSRRSVKDLLSIGLPHNVEFINHGLLNDKQCIEMFSGLDAIVHLAALNEIESVKKPLEAIRVNIAESYHLLGNAVAAKVKKFIFFSTAHVYCSPLSGVISEDILPRPLDPYSITNKAAEDFVLAARNTGDIDAIVLRLSNSFGPPAYPTADRWTLLVNDLCRQAILEKKLVLKTTGRQRRDFICLSDVVTAVLHLIELDKHRSLDGVFNLGGDNSMRVIDMANLVRQRYKAIFGEMIPLVTPDPDHTVVKEENLVFEISKLASTGWKPAGSVEQEIDDTLFFCSRFFL